MSPEILKEKMVEVHKTLEYRCGALLGTVERVEAAHFTAQLEIKSLKSDIASLSRTVERQRDLLDFLHDQAEEKGWDVDHEWEATCD